MSTNTEERNARRTLTGVVTSDKMEKSITVRVERRYRHAKYGKYMRRHRSFLAHDEDSVAGAGDTVEIVSCRPMSKLKRWRLVRVVTVSRAIEGSSAEEARPQQILAAAEETATPSVEAEQPEGGES